MKSNPLLPYKCENVLTEGDHQKLINLVRSFISSKPKVISAEMGEGETTAQPDSLNIEMDKGRAIYNFEIKDLSEEMMSIINVIVNKAKDIDNSVVLRNIVYSIYSLDYGTPQLFPHMDEVLLNNKGETVYVAPCSFLIDYEMDSNTDWKIGNDGVYFNMQNNSFIALDVIRKSHYREPKIFKDKEYVEMLFLYFINGNYDEYLPDIEEQMAGCKPVREEFYKSEIVQKLGNINKDKVLKRVIEANNLDPNTKEISAENIDYLVKKFNSCPDINNNVCSKEHEICRQRKDILHRLTGESIYER